MTEWIWLNGNVLPLDEAQVGVEDRGFQFADGVYEVIRIYSGKLFTLQPHLERLERSAAGLSISLPLKRQELADQMHKLIARSGIAEGMIYLQLTRGASHRNHLWGQEPHPTLLFYARQLPQVPAPGTGAGVKLATVEDERWKRCWIKSIALLPNVLAKNQAVAAGADEAVFVENGIISECSASNFFAVLDGRLMTHPVGPKVLPGITRLVLLEIARELHIPVQERPLRLEEALGAQELFITSTTREIGWVGTWDNHPIANARCGQITLKLHRALRQRIDWETGQQPRMSMASAGR